SIYGGNLPTTPWSRNKYGRGPAWSNSLFEDNAEFGLGLRLAADLQTDLARQRLDALRPELSDELVELILIAPQQYESDLSHQRARVEHVKVLLDEMLTTRSTPSRVSVLFPLGIAGPEGGEAELTGRRGQPVAAEVEAIPALPPGSPLAEGRLRLVEDLRSVADHLLRRSVWIVGGDGWAYDIGSAGVDHVLASGRDINVLVLDTEVYSNTGGQSSKSTPMGAVAKFAAAGKTTYKKDLAMQAIAYGNVYVARVAMGADPQQTLRAFREAEMYDGPSLILAYSHCIAHGIDMRKGLDQQYRAVNSGHWPLMRFNPVLREADKNPFLLDSPRPRVSLRDYHKNELRFRMLTNTHPEEAERLLQLGQEQVLRRFAEYEQMASRSANMFAASPR
ncbi:MAG TPA: thiamine pyrophosphate-dependent enzyme, partial [Micropruina sp.]|nr:thiamine pyrophosphate-dependent enzyme [Micropruina sp.]